MVDNMRNYRTNQSRSANGGGARCTCNSGGRMQDTNCQNMKKKLQVVDFAIIDTVLYLNAYPECREALDYYHKLVEERKMLEKAINEKCGPVTFMGNESRAEWNWVLGPWPWELDAN